MAAVYFVLLPMVKDIEEAVDTSLDVLEYIEFDGMYYRTDIGYEFMPQTPEEVIKEIRARLFLH